MKHVMIDLETLSLQPTAAILSIGAVEFEKDVILREFWINITNREYQESIPGSYFHKDQTTLEWCMEHPEAAKNVLINAIRLDEAMKKFLAWLPQDPYCVWSKNPNFDIAALKHAMRRLDIHQEPWSYRNVRCYRTAAALLPLVDFVPPKLAHISVEDARAQAAHLIKICREMKSAFNVDLLSAEIQNSWRDAYGLPLGSIR